MKIWVAIVLGIIQGIAEFLPISSSGHIILFGSLVGIQVPSFFTLMLHFASLVAIIVFFWKDVIWCLKNPLSKRTLGLVFATFCTAAIAFSIAKLTNIESAVALGPCFILSGFLLILAELVVKFCYKKTGKNHITIGRSFAVGLAQGFCILPGLSRLGTTVSALRLSGIPNDEATSFRLLLSIPVVAGGIVLEIAKGTAFENCIGFWPSILGFIFAFVFACGSLFFLRKVIKNKRWWVFAPYLVALGVLVTIWQYA